MAVGSARLICGRLRSVSVLSSWRKAPHVGPAPTATPESPRRERRDRPPACGPSRRHPSSSPRPPELSPIKTSSSLKRVRMVRRSWDTTRQHGGALLQAALDAPASSRLKACAARRTSRAPARPEGPGPPALLPKLSAASASRRIGRIWVAQEQHRDGDQHQRGADHPQQEDMGVGDISRATRCEQRASPRYRA